MCSLVLEVSGERWFIAFGPASVLRILRQMGKRQ